MKYIGKEINKIIKNEYPLMFLDSIEIQNNNGIGNIYLNNDLWFFKCHYPSKPIMPLSLLIESMTQVFCAIFLSKVDDKNEIPILSSLGNIRILDSAIPGDELNLKATLVSFRRGIATGNAKAYKNNNERPICEFDLVEVLPSQMIRIK